MRIWAIPLFVLCLFLAGCYSCNEVHLYHVVAFREPMPGDVYASGGRIKASVAGPLYVGGKLIVATEFMRKREWIIMSLRSIEK